MVNYHGRFVWHELMTTDPAVSSAFYRKVVGWGAQDASTPDLSYTLLTSGKVPVAGVINLPEEARRMGATARWTGYVCVNDIDATVDLIRRLGGSVYVPPTDSNIGRIAVVADPQAASLALLDGSKSNQKKPGEIGKSGRVGWHELLAADWPKAFAFYGALFGWQKAEAEVGPTETYQLFAVGEDTIGGMFDKRQIDAVPFWLFYFNVGDIDAAIARVESGGGKVFEGPHELPSGIWIARCRDPHGAAFALQGKRSQDGIDRVPGSEVGWSTEWAGISSRGRLVVTKPRKPPISDAEE